MASYNNYNSENSENSSNFSYTNSAVENKDYSVE
jgi:hypothetical protein